MEGQNICCDDTSDVQATLYLKLLNKRLWVTVNGVTASIDLSPLSTGGGGGEIPVDAPVPVDIQLPVSSNGQTLFANVVPENSIVVELIVNTLVFSKGVSFNVVGDDIQWINDEAELRIGDTVILKTWQLSA